ncbi:phospholipase D [Trichodelitschia bisporula]|uniref:Phospholipase D1 n=1 Tax=Trichodelitschia bisporula TaxID=703511 RepID=A0A6G1HU12_9PEZI|nr:phospholipase D [Trichodelitschia bisporula]
MEQPSRLKPSEERDESVSPMTRSPRSLSPLSKTLDNNLTPSKSAQSNGASETSNGKLAPPLDLETKFAPSVTRGDEFPFNCPPAGVATDPVNNFISVIDHAPTRELLRTPEGEREDVATELAPSGLSRKPTTETLGTTTPTGRRSVTFTRDTAFEATQPGPSSQMLHSRQASLDAQDSEGGGKDKEKLGSSLLSKLKALASPITLQSHGRSLSGWSIGDSQWMEGETPIEPDGARDDGQPYSEYEGDADAEESAAEGRPSRTRKRRKSRRMADDGPSTAPTTPRAVVKMPFRRDSDRTPPSSSTAVRPPGLPRRATMTEIPEHQRLAFSEDEGRDRLGDDGLWRRGSAWMHARGQSYSVGTRAGETADSKRPSGLRRLTAFGSHEAGESPSGWRLRGSDRGSSLSAQKWKHLKASIKMLGQRKKEETQRIDHAKSAELMAELLAGAPAALFLASMFQRDEHGHKRIPVLLEQLRVRVTDSQRTESDRHQVFRIELEYGSALARMKWIIQRSLRDFVNLHLKYKFQSKTDKYIHSRAPERSKLPKFPMSSFPYLRGVRGMFEDEEEEEEEDDLPTAGEQSGVDGEMSGVDRPGKPKKRRSSFNFNRRKTGPVLDTPQSIMEASGRQGSSVGGARKETFPELQRRRLEHYLHKLITYVIFRPDSNRLCKFLELSALGVRLAAEGGYHGKEGFMSVKAGKKLSFQKNKVSLLASRQLPKWFLVRASYIVCVDSPEEMNIYEVFLVDPSFATEKKKERLRDEKAKELAKRAKDTARHPSSFHQMRIKNSEGTVKVLAKNERQLHQFEASINFMVSQSIWAQPKRYDSFAPIRTDVYAQALVDGRDYMWNVSRAISMARDVIYIHDWWLSPELYMRRPPAISQKWRLDRLLKRKADEGVKIYVIMYRNVNSAIPIDSEYTKFSLLDLSDNVYVQRSPNQIRQNTFFWAHHEKILVVDHCVAFCGGVDLCFGRWDTPAHTLIDDKLTGFEVNDLPKDADNCQLWPGKDYSNPRVQDFYNLDKPYEEMYDRTKIPRMPWHDIGMQVIGQPARDLSRHFVQRWNFILRQRKPSRPTPMLLPPPDFLPADIEALGLNGTCEVQILRSACQWSLGTVGKVECSIMNAYVDMIRNSEHFVYIENQFFISSCEMENTKIENKIGDALVERIMRAQAHGESWRAVILIPLMPGFQNTVDAQDGSSVRLIMQCQYRSICRGSSSIFERLRQAGIEPEDYIQFYALRSWGKIGPNQSLVTEQLYIHAKCMIVDDRIAIIGSANINERSMLGSRDSEVAAIVRDTDMFPSHMDGEEYYVSRFAHDLRVRLMREHLGLDVDGIREEELEEEQFEREMDAVYQAQEQRRTEDDSSISSPDSDRATEQRLIDNKHRIQEELIARQEQVHSFNHDVDWTQAANPNIVSKKRPTSDPRVTNNPTHRADVAGEGEDHMLEHLDEQVARDTIVDQRGLEVLVSDLAPEGKGSLARPTHAPRRRHRAKSEVEQAVPMPPAPPPRVNTYHLGLPQLSTLPALPVEDDTDIGGPPLVHTLPNGAGTGPGTGYTGAFAAAAADLRRPEVSVNCMRDPLIDTFYQDTWHTVAENNTKLYRQVFRCMPDNEVKTWREYKEYMAFGERFAQSQGAGRSKSRIAQDAKGKSGPPGSGGKIGEMVEKVAEMMPGGEGKDNTPMGGIGEWAEEQEKRVQEKQAGDEKEGIEAEEQVERGEGGRRVTISTPPGSGSANGIANANGNGNGPAYGNGGGSKRRRRATTKSSGRAFHADDDSAMMPKEEAEDMLEMVQGTLVLWPYEWLEKEERGGGWLYAVDQIAPLEIYT